MAAFFTPMHSQGSINRREEWGPDREQAQTAKNFLQMRQQGREHAQSAQTTGEPPLARDSEGPVYSVPEQAVSAEATRTVPFDSPVGSQGSWDGEESMRQRLEQQLALSREANLLAVSQDGRQQAFSNLVAAPGHLQPVPEVQPTPPALSVSPVASAATTTNVLPFVASGTGTAPPPRHPAARGARGRRRGLGGRRRRGACGLAAHGARGAPCVWIQQRPRAAHLWIQRGAGGGGPGGGEQASRHPRLAHVHARVHQVHGERVQPELVQVPGGRR